MKKRNSELFLEMYNEIDQYMRKELKKSDEASHSNLIREMSKKNRVFRNNENDLLDYAKLRNAIVHNSHKKVADPIAEPHEYIVKRYKSLLDSVMNPPKALDTIAIKSDKIFSAQLSNNLYGILKKMKDNSFTHVPIFDGEKFIGVLSENTLFSYMVDNKDVIITTEYLIKELIDYIPIDNHIGEYFEFVERQSLVLDIVEKFSDYLIDTKRLGAIFITENGLGSQKILGMITAWDIAGHLK